MNFTHRALLGAIALFALAAPTHAEPPAGESASAGGPSANTPPLTDPTILLVRDNAVRTALACTDQQQHSLDALLKKNNRLLLAIRDVSPTGADDTAKPALKKIRDELKTILTGEQRVRLQGLILQAQGYDSLLRKDVSTRLRLTPEQQQSLAEISANFRAKVQALQTPDASPRTPEEVQTELKTLQSDRHQQVLAQLDERQQTVYGKLLGEPFDLAQVRPSPADAPEFEGIKTWLNSDPLTIESLRGQVVVVHFFAFGCINCIHNYPWYREWHDAFAGKEVTIIGIHTPETQAETDVEQLRLSLEKHELKFPVAVDADKKIWQAWYNGIWPSVYLIDRQGRVRYWWYGELDWQGAGNQKVARQQIEQLLGEPNTAPKVP
ncbi:MAG: redoxin domain-containing protein [Pirellulales bacterium]|nr:redoxin domain-containing protein [Pirellulales bacterium]